MTEQTNNNATTTAAETTPVATEVVAAKAADQAPHTVAAPAETADADGKQAAQSGEMTAAETGGENEEKEKEKEKEKEDGHDSSAPKENGDSNANPSKKEEQVKDDESWYGQAPDESITKVVKEKLGDQVADLYVRACRQLDGAKDDVQRILDATNTFVTALSKVPEDQQMTVAFGEMSLAHGRALVRYIELEGSGSSAIAAKLVKAIQSAVTAGSGGGAEVEEEGDAEGGEDGDVEGEGEGEEEKADQGDAGKTGAASSSGNAVEETDAVEKAEKKDKKDDDEEEDDSGENEDLENAWTQLEVARVIFSREGLDAREAECRYTLGKLMMACDDGKQSAAEFASAAILYAKIDNKRLAAECHYQHFLAIRNADRPQAAQALRDAVALMQDVSGTDDILEDMKTDLKDFEATMDDEEKAKNVAVPTEVQVVRPKRKRDATAAAEGNTTQHNGTEANGSTANGNGNGSAAPPTKDDEKNGAMESEDKKQAGTDGTEEKQAKKARVEGQETAGAVPEKAGA